MSKKATKVSTVYIPAYQWEEGFQEKDLLDLTKNDLCDGDRS